MTRMLRDWGIIILLAFVVLVANGLVLLGSTDYARALIPDETVRFGCQAAGVFLSSILVYAVGLIRTRGSERKRTVAIVRAEIERKLKSAINFFFPEENPVQVRSNVMLVKKDKLKIICSCNMNAFPDKDLELRIRQGCAGMAWFHGEAVVAPDLGQMEYPYWGLNKNQRDKTSYVKWVVSTPIKHSSSGNVIGVFNLDGTGTLREPSILSRDNEEFLRLCHGYAATIGRIVEEYKMI